jgi:hypothetical protein
MKQRAGMAQVALAAILAILSGCASFGEVDPAHSQLGPLLIEAGEPLTYIQQQLGHHSAGVTLTVYGHLLPRSDRRAVDRLDDPLPEATSRNPRATDVSLTTPVALDSHALDLDVSVLTH